MSGVVVGFGEILCIFIIVLIEWIGFHTHSRTNLMVSIFVFLAYFINTGLLLLVVYGTGAGLK